MKKEISPGVIVAAVVCVLALAGWFLLRAATEKPSYPGMNAGKPTGEGMGGPKQYVDPSQVKSSQEAAKQGFSGATPGGNVPADVK